MDYSGIYRIVHIESGKTYLGSSKNVHKRINSHRYNLRNNKHHSCHLQYAWNKHGEDAFIFIPGESCASDKGSLLALEQACLNAECPAYNILPTAGSRLGSKQSPEARAKISAGNKGKLLGRPKSPEHIEKIRNREISDATRKKIGAAQIGRKATDETRLRMSEAALGKGKDPESIRKAWEEKQRKRFEKRQTIAESLKSKTLIKNDVRPTLRRLTDEQVREIRGSLEAASSICTRYNCTASAINKIRRGLVYKDIF